MTAGKKRCLSTISPGKALVAFIMVKCLFLLVINTVSIYFAEASMASSDGQIVFKRWIGGKGCIFVMDANGGNQRQLTTTGNNYLPKWSPDGRQIVFHEFDLSTRVGSGIYIIDAGGSNMRQLTNGHDYYPTWSPDGKQIMFNRIVRNEKGEKQEKDGGIYVMDSDGTNLKRLTDDFANVCHWHPDGGRVILELFDPDRPGQIWVMDADGGNKRMINDWGYGPVWSPDGRKIAFYSERDAWNPWKTCDIYIMDEDGSNVKRLTDPGPVAEYYPGWSPDGKKIVFSSNSQDNLGNWDIYVMDVDGQNVQKLTDAWEGEFEPDWTAFSYAVEPDGKLKGTWGDVKRR